MKKGEVIKYIREKNHFSQEELSDQLGVNTPLLSQIEEGDLEPSKTFIIVFCGVCGIPESIFNLLCLEENQVPERKRDIFNRLMPTIRELIDEIL